jgi:hypothetical protein
MGAVAERPDPRPSAAAKSDRRALHIDLPAVLIDEPERTANDERAVTVRGDDHGA